MDRLLCGDVGYGKTEVALRAIFKTICHNKQAVILCPTTILARQHYNTAKQRFEQFGIDVELISRLQSNKETFDRQVARCGRHAQNAVARREFSRPWTYST